MEKFIYALIFCLSINLVSANAQQLSEQVQVSPALQQSKFKKLFDKKDAIVITEQYEIADFNKINDLRIFASVGWIEGETNKIYAANIGEIFVDFEQLDSLQNSL